MKSFTRSTGNKDFDFYLRGQNSVIQVCTVLKSKTDATGAVRPGVKYYMPANKDIESATTIGIQFFKDLKGTPGLSDVYPYPAGSVTVTALGLDQYLTVTLCDADGVILFNRVPVVDFIATLRKVKAYTGKICTYKSYFQLTNAPVINTSEPIVVNLAFFLRT
jgi:hypothetical protein